MDAVLNIIDREETIIDYEKIREKYDFYLIKNAENGKYKPNSRIFDDPLIDKNVLAIQYTGGSAFIVMMKHDRQNESNIMKLIQQYNEECGGTLTKEELLVPFEKAQHSMLLVMFNALAKSAKHEDVSNLGGKLYYFTSKKSKQIFCLELRIDKDYVITLSNKTFTINNKPLGQPEYLLQKNNTMRRRNKDDKEGPFYTIYQYKGTKHETPFLDVSKGKFYSTRVGVLTKLLDKFNKEYEGIVKLEIKKVSAWNKINVKNAASLKKEHLRNLKKLLDGKTIRIINKIDDDYSEIAKELCNNIKKQIEEIFQSKDYFLKDDRKLNFKVKIAEKEGKSDLNIRLNHDREFYEEHPEFKDTYKKSNEMAIQNITLEDFSKDKKMIEAESTACIVVLNELIVKSDLPKPQSSTGKITIFDWSKLNFKSNWTFCWCDGEWKDNGPNIKKMINHFYFMVIQPDGRFEIGEKNKNLFNQEEFDKLEEIFSMNNMKLERHNKSNEKYKGLVMNDMGEINIIQDTPFRMLPDLEKMKEVVREGKNPRINAVRDSYFLGCLDILYKEQKDFALYSVNQIGGGMNTSVPRAANIRKIITYGDGPIFFEELLNTMNVTFVRNGQLTVLPFPFKYLREFIERTKSW